MRVPPERGWEPETGKGAAKWMNMTLKIPTDQGKMARWRGRSGGSLSVNALLYGTSWHCAARLLHERKSPQGYQANLQESHGAGAVFLQIWRLARANFSVSINGL